jgi:hypothetical protein
MIRTWKDWAQLIDKALAEKRLVEARALIDSALVDDVMTDRAKRIYQHNDAGKPYSSMSQMCMGNALIRAAKKLDDPELEGVGVKCIRTATDLVADGGLRRQTNSGSWYHSISNTASTVKGGTLNQHLFTVRELATTAKLLEYPIYLDFAQDGYDQLVGGSELKFTQFIPRTDSGAKIAKSWVWYSRTYDDDEGFFLKGDPDRNGGYHCLCMDLIASLPGKGINMHDAAVLGWLWDVWQAKVKAGLYENTPTNDNGNFSALEPGREPKTATLEWFKTI